MDPHELDTAVRILEPWTLYKSTVQIPGGRMMLSISHHWGSPMMFYSLQAARDHVTFLESHGAQIR